MVFNCIWMLHNWFLGKIRFKQRCPEKILWKSARRNILKEINNCQVIACFEFFCTNIGTIILIKAWVGSWRKSGTGILFNVAPSPKYNGLTSGVSNAIIHNKNTKMAHLYFRRSKRFISRGKKLQIFVDKKYNTKQPQNNKQKVERIFQRFVCYRVKSLIVF